MLKYYLYYYYKYITILVLMLKRIATCKIYILFCTYDVVIYKWVRC